MADAAFPTMAFQTRGYETVHHGNGRWNGVAILSRVGLEDPVAGFSGEEESEVVESRLLAATCGGVRVTSVYVPNGRSVGTEHYEAKLAWLERLHGHLLETGDPDEQLAICGDFNIAPDDRDVHDPDLWRGKIHFHPREHAALARITGWGLFDLFRKHHTEGGFYSWWDYRQLAFQKNNGLRIDLILGTSKMLDRCTGVEIFRDERKGESPSDHVPVVATFK